MFEEIEQELQQLGYTLSEERMGESWGLPCLAWLGRERRAYWFILPGGETERRSPRFHSLADLTAWGESSSIFSFKVGNKCATKGEV